MHSVSDHIHVSFSDGTCLVRSEDSRVTTTIILGLNAFLLHHGCDVASCAAELHLASGRIVRRVLTNPRDEWLADAVHTYLRIQLKLGALQVRLCRMLRLFRRSPGAQRPCK